VQVVPFVDRYILDLHKVKEASSLTSSGVIQISPERGDREPDPIYRNQIASIFASTWRRISGLGCVSPAITRTLASTLRRSDRLP
jgi:hypothetical protein